MKVLVLLLSLCCGCAQLKAQTQQFLHQKWEGGPLLTFAQYRGDMSSEKYNLKGFHSGFGLLIRRRCSDNFYLRSTFFSSKISGNDLQNPNLSSRGFSFQSPVNDLNVVAEYDFGGRRRYRNHFFHKIISPYMTLGASVTHINPKTDFNETQNKTIASNISIDKNMDVKSVIPSLNYGFGLKIDVNNGWALNLDFTKRLSFYDYIDGVSASASKKHNDILGFVSAGLIYRFRKKNDKDRDGISDKYDFCPAQFGNPLLSGCPDKDGDLVPDKDDLCPTEAGDRNLSGCPQALPSYQISQAKNKESATPSSRLKK